MVEASGEVNAGWRRYLRADPVPWLLEPANPSARYLTLRHVLGRPADSLDVTEARAGILRADPAASILAAQWPDGYWVTPDRGYTPRYRATVWQIMFLAQLGAPRDARIERACEFVWENSRRDGGLFTPHKHPRLRDTSAGLSASLANLNGNLLWTLAHFGYAGDPRTEQVVDALAALNLTRLLRADDVAAVVKLARGLQALPADLPAPLRSFLDDAVEFVADHLSPQADDEFLRLGFPLAEKTDLLEMLTVLLQETDAVRGAPVRSAVALIVTKQDQRGRWLLDAVPGKMWVSFGEPGRANKWVTVRALRVLQSFREVV
jgi:hypothetical protein